MVLVRKNTKFAKVIDCALLLLIFLSLFDLIMTITWVSTGEAEEANPIMNFFLQKSFYLFALIKLFLTFGGILILDRYKNIADKLIFKACLVLVLIYAALSGWHIIGVFTALT